MSILNSLFLAHPSLTTVRWRPHFRVQVAETSRSTHFEAFRDGLRQAIPAAFASQRIQVVVDSEQIPQFEGYLD
uniref:Uncharacterized protein n=1 Tax=Mycena chlorophos TaxID=658473 RepID=A0ABQ0LHJ7_MYCCL|nr:predicted protein [Mycena chlorophos]